LPLTALDLRQGLIFLEAIEHLLGAGLYAKGEKGTVGLGHDRKLVGSYRVDPPLATPGKFQFTVDNSVANLTDAFAVQQKLVVGER
jgi:hypothetical protein